VITPSEGPLQRGVLRIGCGPLHAVLLQSGEPRHLPSAARTLAALQPLPLDPAPPQQWLQLLRHADLDGLLLPAEAVAASATTSDPGHVSPGRVSSGQHCSPELLQVVPLGCRPLLLLVHSDQLQAAGPAAAGRSGLTPAPPRLLLTAAWGQHQQALAALGLLPLEIDPLATAELLLGRLRRERLLLPAGWELLEQPPWCDAGLVPLPLHEQLVLLVSPAASQPAITALTGALRHCIRQQRRLLRQLTAPQRSDSQAYPPPPSSSLR